MKARRWRKCNWGVPPARVKTPTSCRAIWWASRTTRHRTEFRFVSYLLIFPKCFFIFGILANSPTASPENFNKSSQQKFFTGNGASASNANNPQVYQNVTHSGPPTTGLFDYLKNDKSFQTPTKNFANQQQSFPSANAQNQSFHNQSSIFSPSSSVLSPGPAFNQSGFNQSRIMSPIVPNALSNADFDHSRQYQHNSTFNSPSSNSNFWVTVFGFPLSQSSEVLCHFSQCGAIVEKVFSSGNWIHLKFASKLECDKALLYNGKIIYNNLMIGVTKCTDESVVGKENSDNQRAKVRSLTQNAAYRAVQEPSEVIMSPNAPKRTTGIINKTLDMFFGW